MKLKFTAVMSFVIGVALLLLPLTPVAAESTFQVETTSYLISTQWLPVGDEDGHVIGIQKRDGDAVFTNGETAKYLNVYTLDFHRGTGGTARGYSTFTFEDKSSITCAWTAEIPVVNGLFSKQGEGTIINGTGRFANLKGTAEFTGKQVKTAAQDPRMVGATTYTFLVE